MTTFPSRFLSNELRSSMEQSPAGHLETLLDEGKLKAGDELSEREIQGIKAVLTGNQDLAVSIFNELESSTPGRYRVAANLGTAYELKGDFESALHWIREGIRRNPDAHEGTEWLHVQIIRARMKLREDPDFLRNHHVIEVSGPPSENAHVEIDGNTFTLDQMREALHYQLKERMIFVKPADPVVADLLYTYGDVFGVMEHGLVLLRMAGEYGFQNPPLLAAKINRYQWLIRFRMLWQTGLVVLALSMGILFLVYAHRKKWFFLTEAAKRRHQSEVRAMRRASQGL